MNKFKIGEIAFFNNEAKVKILRYEKDRIWFKMMDKKCKYLTLNKEYYLKLGNLSYLKKIMEKPEYLKP